MKDNETIVSARLRIIPFGEQHLTDRYVGWLNDPNVVRYSEQRFATHTIESCRAYWASFRDTPHYFWAIELSEGDIPGKHIGNINAYLETRHGLADLGILIGDREIWGKGYGTEAWVAVCDWLFNNAGVRKITAGTLACNHGMRSIMSHAGMVDDGQHFRHYLFEGEEMDVIYRAVFAKDWINRIYYQVEY